MDSSAAIFANQLFEALDRLVPVFRKNTIDYGINEGNVACFVVSESGEVWGKTYGDSKPRLRETSITAWKKATQVWVTQIATGEYEKKVYNDEVEWFKYGIMKPDLIGWLGGLPHRLFDGSFVAVSFSGFRGEMDVEILQKAIASIS